LILLQILVFFTILTFSAQCTSTSSNFKVCGVNHIVPLSDADNSGDAYVYNTLTQSPSTTKDCAQAFANYKCSVLYPTCDPATNPGTTQACQSLCNNFVSQCNGQLSSVTRDNCASLPSNPCTSNSGSISSLYPSPSPSKLSGGAIAGIVIGVIIFVILVIVIAFVVKGGISVNIGTARRAEGERERVDSDSAEPKNNNNNKGKGREARESENPSGTATLSVKVDDAKKAKAPESPSPRLSLTVGTAVAGTGNPANERETKIKEQLEALPEAHKKPPPPWGIYYTDDGDLYFWNSETDESSWEYPIKN